MKPNLDSTIRLLPAAALAVASCCALLGGCTRPFWRQQADRATYTALAEHLDNPRWMVPRIDVTADPRSRFFDPYCPDCGPLPPDDPAAHRYMRCADGMHGSKSWHLFGRAFSIENPQWLAPFDLPTESTVQTVAHHDDREAGGGETVQSAGPASPEQGESPRFGIEDMSLPEAIEVSLIQSRDYQTAIEEVYLSALDLTFERFQFDVRYLGTSGREPSADLAFETVPSGQNSLSLDTRFGARKLFPAGAQLAVELANNTIWLFSGPNRTDTSSVLSYSIVQPLLQGGGRKIVLENLTQQERNVLYAARDLARFRKTFFTDTVAGGASNGFLGLLQQRQVVLNQRDNIRLLVPQVERLRVLASQKPEEVSEALAVLPPNLQFPADIADQVRYDPARKLLFWSGDMSASQAKSLRDLSEVPDYRTAVTELIQRTQLETVTLDVAQLETRLANSRNALRGSQRRYQDLLDRYKIQLGLPPEFFVSLDDTLLQQFQLIDPKLTAVIDEVDQFVAQWARLDPDDTDAVLLRDTVARLEELLEEVRQDVLGLVDADVEKVQENVTQRLSRLPTEAARDEVLRGISRDRRLYTGIQEEFRDIEATLRQLQADVSGQLDPAETAAAVRIIAELREQLLKLTQSLQVIQVDLRVELIELQQFDLSIDKAVQIGLENRLDLMNVRARVMDARRRVEVAANNLEAVLDLVAEGDVRTGDSNRPFDFRGDRSRFRAGVSFVAPLDKVAARNDYRESLIDYQRARRDYMAFEDQLKLQIRDAWRQLYALARNFESARQAVRFAALQLDQAVEEASAPVAPGQARQSGSQGLNLLNALNSLLNAQNDLIGIWVDYERNRLNIHRDMGIMEVDARGIWNDEIYQQLAQQTDPLDEVRQHAIRDETRTERRRHGVSSSVRRHSARRRSTRSDGQSVRG